MFKKIVLLVLAAALLAGMLCACSANPVTPASASVSQAPTPTPSPTETATPTPTPTPSASPSPAPSASPDMNPYGTVSGQKYTNNLAGLEITLPQGYQIINTKDSISEYALKAHDARKAAFDDQEPLDTSTIKPGFVAYMHPEGKPEGLNNEVKFQYAKVEGSENTSTMEIAQALAEASATQDETSDPVAVSIGGTDGAAFTCTYKLDSGNLSDTYTVFKNNGYVLIFGCSALDEAGKTAMDAALKTIKFTKTEPAASAADDDISGIIDGNTYTNDAAGFTITYPDSYTVLTKDGITKQMAQTIEKIKDMYKDGDLIKKAMQQTIPVSMAFKHPLDYGKGINTNINIEVQQYSVSGDIVDFTNNALDAARQQTDSFNFGEAKAGELGGHEAAVATMTQTIQGVDIYQKMYYVSNNEYLISVTLSAGNQKDMKEADKIVNTIEFYS